MPFATSPPRVISRTGIILFCFQYFMLLFTVIACLREFKDVFVFSVSKWHLWQSVYQHKNASLPLFCSTLSLDNLIILLHINSCATTPKTFEVICFFFLQEKATKNEKITTRKWKKSFFSLVFPSISLTEAFSHDIRKHVSWIVVRRWMSLAQFLHQFWSNKMINKGY